MSSRPTTRARSSASSPDGEAHRLPIGPHADNAYVALLLIHLHFPDSGSLKSKRKDLASAKAQLRTRLGVSVSEVEGQDTWQRATLAVAITAGSVHGVQEHADRVERFIVERFPDGARVDRTVRSFAEVDD
jgi:uncharacterized protein